MARRSLRLSAGVVVPIAAFVGVRQASNSDAAALGITEAIPVAWMLLIGLRQHRIDPIAVVAAVVLAGAAAISAVSGGSALPLKLRRSFVTGTLGLACLGSVLARRPLLPTAMGLLARSWPRSERLSRLLLGQPSRHATGVMTTIIGATLLADAAAQLTLALSVSTAAFVGASRLARIAVFALGLGACALYLRKRSASDLASNDVHTGADPR